MKKQRENGGRWTRWIWVALLSLNIFCAGLLPEGEKEDEAMAAFLPLMGSSSGSSASALADQTARAEGKLLRSIPITAGKNDSEHSDYGFTVNAYDLMDMKNAQHVRVITKFKDNLSFSQEYEIGKDWVRIKTTVPQTGETKTSEVSIPEFAQIPAEHRIDHILVSYLTSMRFAYPRLRGALMSANLPPMENWQPVAGAPPSANSCDEARQANANVWAQNRGVNCYCMADGTCWCDGKQIIEPYKISTQRCPTQRIRKSSGGVTAAMYGEEDLRRVSYGDCDGPGGGDGQDFQCSSGAPQEWGLFDKKIDFRPCCLEHDRAFYCGGDHPAFHQANTNLSSCVMGQVTNAYLEWLGDGNENVFGVPQFIYMHMLWAACKIFSATGTALTLGCDAIGLGALAYAAPNPILWPLAAEFAVEVAAGIVVVNGISIYTGTRNYFDWGWPRTGGCDNECNQLTFGTENCDAESCRTAKARQRSCLCKQGGLPVPSCDPSGCFVNDCSLSSNPMVSPNRLQVSAWKNTCSKSETMCEWYCEKCIENRGTATLKSPSLNVTANQTGEWSIVPGSDAFATIQQEKVIDCGWKVIKKNQGGPWVADDGECAGVTQKCGINCCPEQKADPFGVVPGDHAIVSLTRAELNDHLVNNTPIFKETTKPITVPRPHPDLRPPVRPRVSGNITEAHPPLGYVLPWQALAPRVELAGVKNDQGVYIDSVTVRLVSATPGARIYCRTDGTVPMAWDRALEAGGTTWLCSEKSMKFTTTTNLRYQVVSPGFEPNVGQLHFPVAINAGIGNPGTPIGNPGVPSVPIGNPGSPIGNPGTPIGIPGAPGGPVVNPTVPGNPQSGPVLPPGGPTLAPTP